jgi:hypothetical protein
VVRIIVARNNVDQDIYLKSITHVRMLAAEVSERNSVELKEKD